MKKKLSFREWLREEREKLGRMSVRQGIKYIWQYYSLFIIGAIAAVWFLVYFITHLIAGAPEYWLYASFANSTASIGKQSRIWRDFVEYSGYDTKEKNVEFSGNMYFDYNRNQARGNEYYNSFIALVDSGTLDLITMFPEQLAPLGESGRLMNWDLEQCAALREQYAGRLIYYVPPEDAEETEPVPVGIDISDSLLVTEYGIYPETAALGIAVQSTRLDAVEKFLDFIMSK
ncbi:MAG: hypothetical protein IKP86_01555 [Anaerolineaceae bacterium]|nr:hypothetical protein [Anaerolineaceae bacterium]